MDNCPYFASWPQIADRKDPNIERFISSLLDQMTLDEKIGQMIQPNLRDVTPEEARDYKLGSILNGGGAWPNENKRASAKEWAQKADEFWLAVEQAYEKRPFRIPFMWATDAVHGHNNAFGATVFPHNIGLGAAKDPELIRRIGEITAREIAATGLDWTFAPTVATPRNLRWGRVYEGYSEDPTITYHYAKQMVMGLQGSESELKSDVKVISNVKHWLGDGGTINGVDRGVNNYSEELLRNIHAPGYFSGLQAGAQVVMSSFNSWRNPSNYDHTPSEQSYNHKIHGSRYLLTDVLKQQMGFDGIVVTDWHGHAEVSKCTDGDASYAINAGNDVLMVPVREHWQAVWQKTKHDVLNGLIPLNRIDDAVLRILRVKARAGLWDKPCPSQRQLAGKPILGQNQHRAVAREAVRKSLVLLKNDHNVLPLNPKQKLWLTGSAANDLQKQSGGWNLTWQGDENSLDDFPGATTLKMALEQEVDLLEYDPELKGNYQSGDVAIVAFGEDPYAEMMGDIKTWQSLEFSTLKRSYAKDCDYIARLSKKGVKVIALFFSGRPLYMNQEIDHADAFVAAWLPGSEGLGITDVLIGDAQGLPRFEFSGTLSFSWPNKKRSDAVNSVPTHIANYQLPSQEQDPNGEHRPLFALGYGLNYQDRVIVSLELDEEQNQSLASERPLELFGIKANIGDFKLSAWDDEHIMGVDVSRNNPLNLRALKTIPYNYQQQQDSVQWICHGGMARLAIRACDGGVEDLSQYAHGLRFEIKAHHLPESGLYVGVTDNEAHGVEISNQLKLGEFVTVNISQALFASVDLRYIETPFVLSTQGKFDGVVANIGWYS